MVDPPNMSFWPQNPRLASVDEDAKSFRGLKRGEGEAVRLAGIVLMDWGRARVLSSPGIGGAEV